MEDMRPTVDGTQSTTADDSESFIAVALILCFTLILFVAFRYTSPFGFGHAI